MIHDILRIFVICCVAMFVVSQHSFAEPRDDPSEYDEKVERRLNELREGLENYTEPDLSKISTETLVLSAISASSDPSPSFKSYFNELSKRPKETRLEIDKLLAQEELKMVYLGALPYVAEAVSVEFQIETARECIFHPSCKQFDVWFLGQGKLLQLLAKSAKDESAVLDKLIEEGRMTLGGEVDLAWRSKLSSKSQNDRVSSAGESGDISPVQSTNTNWREHATDWRWIVGALIVATGLIGWWRLSRSN